MTKKRRTANHFLSESLWFTKKLFIPRSITTIITLSFCLSLVITTFITHSIYAAEKDTQISSRDNKVKVAHLASNTQTDASSLLKRANFENELASQDARSVADWVVDSGDNKGMPFVIVDKKEAKVFVFYPDGKLRGAAPALLGLAIGDDAIPGIGNREMSTIRPEERTTPAGRFVSYLGINYYKKDILWVDYDGAVSMHRVVTNKPEERRLERLTTPTPLDNRISYGCINVPVKFFNTVLKPSFTGKTGVVYVLPEVKSKKEIFASYYDVDK